MYVVVFIIVYKLLSKKIWFIILVKIGDLVLKLIVIYDGKDFKKKGEMFVVKFNLIRNRNWYII